MRYLVNSQHFSFVGYVAHCKYKAKKLKFIIFFSELANMVKSAQNYWKPQTIDRMTPWKEISDQVEEKRSAKGCDAIESSEESGKDEL